MSMGAGMAVGMGAGMGAGIAAGIATGQKQARNRIREYAELQGTTLQNAAGKPLDWDEFLDESLLCCGGTRKSVALVLGLVGGLVLLAAGLTLFFLMR